MFLLVLLRVAPVRIFLLWETTLKISSRHFSPPHVYLVFSIPSLFDTPGKIAVRYSYGSNDFGTTSAPPGPLAPQKGEKE